MDALEAAISRGKIWIEPDGTIGNRYLSGRPDPPFGTVFIRDDPYTLEIYGHKGKLHGQVFLSDEQRRMIIKFLSARP